MLNVRINHKYDTLENWKSSTIVLGKGELAIVEIPSGSTGSGLTPPAIGVKVGDGVKTFNGLPWIQSTAGDVYAWAKSSTKPTYQASEIEGLGEYVAGEIQDTNTTYQFSYSNDKLIVQSREKTSESWVTVATLNITLSTKVDKVTSAVTGNLPQFTAGGGLSDSGKKVSDFLTTTAASGTYAKQTDLTSLEESVTDISTRVGEAEGNISDLQSSMNTLKADAATEGSIKKQVADAVAGIVNGAPEDFNTLKEMSDWIASHTNDASAMNSAITQNSNDINSLQESSHTHSNKNTLDGINDARVAAWNAAVQSVDGLTTTKSGTKVTVTAVPSNLLTNVEGETLTLNCGTSTTVI